MGQENVKKQKETVSLSLAIARMSKMMCGIKKNKTAGGKYRYATLDHLLNRFYHYSSSDIPLGVYFNERYLGDSTYETECVLYHILTGEERRSSVIAVVPIEEIPKTSDGRQQVNVVQWAGEKQTYMMRMSLRAALGVSPTDDNDCDFPGTRTQRPGYAAKTFAVPPTN